MMARGCRRPLGELNPAAPFLRAATAAVVTRGPAAGSLSNPRAPCTRGSLTIYGRKPGSRSPLSQSGTALPDTTADSSCLVDHLTRLSLVRLLLALTTIQAGATTCSGSGMRASGVWSAVTSPQAGRAAGSLLGRGRDRLGVPRGTIHLLSRVAGFIPRSALASSRSASAGEPRRCRGHARAVSRLKPDAAHVCHPVRVPPLLGLNTQ